MIGPQWPESGEIQWPIFENERFIVFIDMEDDLDWFVKDDLSKEEEAKIAKVRAEVANLEPRSSEWPKETKLAFKRMLGEALALAFGGDFNSASNMVSYARGFWDGRSREIARVAYIRGCAIASSVVLIIWIIIWNLRLQLPGQLLPIFTGMGAGALGSLYSVLLRSNRLTLEPNSPAALHALDGALRIVVGLLGALVVSFAWRLKFLGQFNSAPEDFLLAIAFVGLIAGASERLAPSIIEKSSSALNREPRNP